MAVWRLQTNTDGGNIGRYCLDHRVAAMGWSLIESPQNIRESIGDDFERYLEEARSYGYKNPNVPIVKRMYSSLSVGDLIWMRHNGQYFMGRVSEDSKWQFNPTEESRQLDVANQYTNIEWKRYFEGDESSVPGAICTSFIKGSTLQRINKPYVLEYSQMLYDIHAPIKHYGAVVPCNQEIFYSLLSTDDCEDLLCLWLYHTRGYFCIPSTSKIGTELYERVLREPNTGKHIYVQVKAGEQTIDADRYKNLDGEVWFLTTRGTVINTELYQNMHIVSPHALFEFAMNPESSKILSRNINLWVSFLKRNTK
jgi:hypothetical protein